MSLSLLLSLSVGDRSSLYPRSAECCFLCILIKPMMSENDYILRMYYISDMLTMEKPFIGFKNYIEFT